MLCEESIEVGALIQALSRVFSIEITQFSIKIISFLAILTSVFGVGLALSDILRRKYNLSKVLSVLFVTVIPTVVAILIPNAFLRILNFSGILLAIIAIIVPTLISVKMRNSQTLKSINLLLSNRLILAIIFALGVTIIVLGCLEWL